MPGRIATAFIELNVDTSKLRPGISKAADDVAARASADLDKRLSGLRDQVSATNQRIADTSAQAGKAYADNIGGAADTVRARVDGSTSRITADIAQVGDAGNGAGRGLDTFGRAAGDAGKKADGASSSSRNLHLGLTSIIGAASAAVPALAGIGTVAAAVGAGLVGTFSAAAAGVGAFALAAKPVVGSINTAADAQQKYNKAVETFGPNSKQATTALKALQLANQDLTPAEKAAAQGMSGFKDAYQSWTQSFDPQILPVLGTGLAIAKQGMVNLTPVIQQSGNALAGVGKQILDTFSSPAVVASFQQFAGQAGKAIGSLGPVLANIVPAALNLFQALNPVMTIVEQFLVKLGPQLPAMASSLAGPFQSLAGVVTKIGPMVGEFFRSVGTIALALVHALEPLAPVALRFLDALAKMVATQAGPVFMALSNAIGSILTALTPLIPILGQTIASLVPMIPSLGQLAVSFVQVGVALAPILPPLAQLLGLLAGLAAGLLSASPGFTAVAGGAVLAGIGIAKIAGPAKGALNFFKAVPGHASGAVWALDKFKNQATSTASKIGSFASDSASSFAKVGSKAGEMAKDFGTKTADMAKSGAHFVAEHAKQLATATADMAKSGARFAAMVAVKIAGYAATAAAALAAFIAENLATLGIIAGIALVIAAVLFLVTHWKAAWKIVTDVVGAVVGFIKEHWQLILGILTGPVGLAVLFIKDHWNMVTKIVSDVIDWVKEHWQLILAIITGPIGLAVKFIVDHFNGFIGFFTGLPDKIKAVALHMWDSIRDGFKTVVNDVVDLWNKTIGSLSFTLPSWIPGIGGDGFSMPKIPHMEAGGIAMGGLTVVGERGRELVNMPGGTQVFPHAATERMISSVASLPQFAQMSSAQALPQLAAMRTGGGPGPAGAPTPTPAPAAPEMPIHVDVHGVSDPDAAYAAGRQAGRGVADVVATRRVANAAKSYT